MTAIVDYDMGNVKAIGNMLKKIGREAVITSDPDVLQKADRYILPGVGAFDEGMRRLRQSGLAELLERHVMNDGKPILGICLGMQLLTRRSDEGELPGLGWIDAETLRFDFSGRARQLPVPHMGWNRASVNRPGTLFEGLEENRFYFVHSYYVRCGERDDVLATADYGMAFDCSFGHGNIYGVQFHPEKSHRFGMRLLENFCRISHGL